MRRCNLLIPIIALLLAAVFVPQVRADVSRAAVLYLRIAPGARAAGMGEAFVAIADDATSTHWNPAGLGAYPLTPTWIETRVPSDLQPVSGLAAVKARRGVDYTVYDVWALTEKGLARYDNKKWYLYEEFETRTDETVRQIVASYFSLTDDALIDRVSRLVAAHNNAESYDYLQQLRERVVGAFPESYSSYQSLQDAFDTLIVNYNLCLIKWSKIREGEKLLKESMKDSSLTASEMEKIFFAFEGAKTRFIPEALKIPYSALFGNDLKAIASTGSSLLVASDSNLYGFADGNWQVLLMTDLLPSARVTSLASGDGAACIGTDKGALLYDGYGVSLLGEPDAQPPGQFAALAPDRQDSVWAVADGKLYLFDGSQWSDSRRYIVVLDDTAEKIARKFALYGTENETGAYLARLKEVNRPQAPAAPDSTAQPSEPPAETSAESDLLVLNPGDTIRVPFVSEIKGAITTMHIGRDEQLWFATEYGVVRWDGSRWSLPGYRQHTVAENETLQSILENTLPGQSAEVDTWKPITMAVNDLDSEELTPGQAIWIRRNPAAAPVRAINSRGGRTYFASSEGMLQYDRQGWSRVDLHGLGYADAVVVEERSEGLWLATSDKIVTRADSKTEFSLMYVKWLPELADDLFYTFGAVASHKEGWGTIGASFTYISYGTIIYTDPAGNEDPSKNFESFDLAGNVSWGTSLTDKLKLGLSSKVLYSRLAELGQDEERGEGTATGFAMDCGLLYLYSPRLRLGMSVTNLGPDMAYIDAAQADPLPRNLALGAAYKILQSDYYYLMATLELNKALVGLDDSFRDELQELVYNGGVEFLYADLLALRGGYIFDEEGDVKTITVGVGIGPVGIFKFDFSYIPSNSDVALANTMRWSLSIQP
ncbi:MAG: PorV/PorQ family protein [Candidatus Zixiibacteriota bacterium]|nr:MAG: PorV/PorQ family protein [candidate division Zixibacteria bacterium]